MKKNALTYQTCMHVLLLLLGLSACSSKEDIPQPEPLPEQTEIPIRWNVKSDESVESKALVDNDVLQGTCTPTEGSTCESIGVWGQYVIEEDGQTSTHIEFDAEPLTYAAKTEDTNPYNDWNYPGEARHWVSGGVYTFRACYPQALMTSMMTQMDATLFQGGPINTLTIQEDMLVAATFVNTQTADLSQPVPLNMQHIFAALKFKVRAADDYTPSNDELVTSCWLQNQNDATDLFTPSGYLVHSGNETPEIRWYPYQSSTAPMYVWEHDGLAFSEESILYTSNNEGVGSEYTTNDGWLLVVPQTVKESTLHFCYTLKNSGNYVFSKPIPAVTYQHGKKYTYVLTISGSEVDVTLTIAEWNKLDSTHDIIL